METSDSVWNRLMIHKPETHKTVAFSDGKKTFDGFIGVDKHVYRIVDGIPVEEPNAAYWIDRPLENKE
jgi:hypothetical protein|tara:strand:+ start:328 stop:531 length:204 start_codon:yes stop_codon:yes gene_type:complete